jgi:predicted MFS family arabinose efflux permease
MSQGAGALRLVIGLFFAVLAVNIMDRQLMAILGESIKRDLDLSDTELGALTGLVFALFYAAVGLPVAALADRTDRARILGWTTIISSGFTAACGVAGSFLSLAAARAGVAIGDAGGAPTIWSLVCSYFQPNQRAKVIATIQMGVPVGAVLAFVVGGQLAQHLDWKFAFFVVGAIGAILGVLALLLVPEPRRAERAVSIRRGEPVLISLKALLVQPAFCWGVAAVAFAGMAMFGLAAWVPSVMQRVHGWEPGQTGLAVGLTTAAGGLLGTWVSGVLAHNWRVGGDHGAEFSVPMAAAALAAPAALASAFVADPLFALAIYGVAVTCLLAWNAPSIAAFQLVATDRSRALAASLHVFFVNMFGLGLGPLLIGVVSDALAPNTGEGGLTIAVAAVVTGASVIAAACFFLGARALRKLDPQTHAPELIPML